VFAALGLLIAAVGIYGVMAYVVAQRTQEIGIRKALGAPSSHILGGILGRASAQILVGLMVGLSAAWMMDGLVASFLFDVDRREVGLYTMAAGVLAAVGLAAALIPARRAARIDPVIALRSQ
jgi:ABC-type antimicrobial peptide transport system permease subunit